MVTPRLHRGFTLLEAIAGSVILGLALVAILGLVGQSLASQARGEQLEIAAMLIDEQLSLVLAVGPEEFDRQFKSSGRCAAPYEDFRYDIDIRSAGEGDPYRVTASVSWRSGNDNRELTIETLVAPRLGDDPDPDRLPPSTPERES